MCTHGATIRSSTTANGVEAAASGPLMADVVPLLKRVASMMDAWKGRDAVLRLDLTDITGLFSSAVAGLDAMAVAAATNGAAFQIVTTDPEVIAALQRHGFGSAICGP